MATLIVTPRSVAPGRTIRLSVRNMTDSVISYGLGNRFQRYDHGTWTDVGGEVSASGGPNARSVQLTAAPGEVAGPEYDVLIDSVTLADALESGFYRVSKEIRTAASGSRTVIHARFRVERAGPAE